MEPQAIRTVYATSAEVAIDPAEALRYMGAQPGDEAAQTLLEACMEKAQRAFSYRACFARFPVSLTQEHVVLPFGTVQSADLAKHLDGCGQIWLLAATAGFAIDRLISKYSALQPSHGLCYQALGAVISSVLFCSSRKHCRSPLASAPAMGIFRWNISPRCFRCWILSGVSA